jgi:hypothetical protein
MIDSVNSNRFLEATMTSSTLGSIRAVRCIFLCASILVFVSSPVAGQVSTTFDADLDGWLVTGDNSTQWQATGGNPDGCLDVNDLATGQLNWAIAPSRYHGDWTGATTADSISVDYLLDRLSGSFLSNPTFILSGPGGRAESAEITPPELVWTTSTVTLDPNEWTVTSGDWASLMANVTSVRVGGEFVNGSEELLIDNVVLSFTPSFIFVPCVLDDFNDGTTGDWSFADSSSSNPDDGGGNGGGYVRIGDTGGVLSKAFAPATFLGDWSSLDGTGTLMFDLRVLSSSGIVTGSSELVRLSGPGGVAVVSMDPEDVPTSPIEWRRIQIPIDSSAWTMVEGTWGALLADVRECRLGLEFADGTETVGLDNFGRFANTCEIPEDDGVFLHEAGFSITERLSAPAVNNVARNPVDGNLYGLVRDTSVGDGLWALTGDQAGTLIQAYDRPAHLIFDTDGDAFISEHFDGIINRLEWGGTSSLWVSGLHSGDDDPFGFAVAPPGFDGAAVDPGEILVTDFGSGGADEIWVFSPDVAEGEAFLASTTGMNVYDLASGTNGMVYGCDALDGDNLRVIAADGTVTDLALSQDIGSPSSLVFDPDSGDLFVATQRPTGDAVYRVDPSTGTVALFADGFVDLDWCSLELADSRLWVTDVGFGRIYEIPLWLFSDGFESGDTGAWSSVTQ